MTYNEDAGFNSICKRIRSNEKAFSSKDETSMYWLSYLFTTDNSCGKALSSGYLKQLMSNNLDPAHMSVDQKPNGQDKTFLRKGHQNGTIVCVKKYRPFLEELCDFLVLDRKNVPFIRPDNVKVIEQNLADALTENDIPVPDSQSPVFEFVLGHPDQSPAFRYKLDKMRKSNPLLALTWLLIFSLFPDAEEIDRLKNRLMAAFEHSYSDNILIPGGLTPGMSKFKEQIAASEPHFNINSRNKIALKDAFDLFYESEVPIKDYPFGGNESRLLLMHLFHLKLSEDFERSKNNEPQLKVISRKLQRGLDFFNFELDRYANEDLYLIGYQLWLLSESLSFNLKQYDVQEDILLTMEQRLYAHIDFADKYPELYGIVKRRQGICQNRKCNYAEAIRCYTSAMFLFTGKNYDRSKVKNNEAVIYRRWMRIDMACQTFDEAYRLRKERESFAPETIDPLRSNQVIPLSLAGQFKEAEEIIEPVLRHRREEYENDPARKFKYLMTLLNSLQLIVVQGYRTEEPKQQTDLKIQFDKRADETEQVLQNITPDAGSFQYHVNLDLLRSGQFLLEKRYDMALLKAKSALKLFDELGTLDSLSEKKSLCVAYLYECKAYCAKNQNPEALESALAAFRLANELCDCRNDKSYFRYFYMVAAYHLAAILTMTDGQENSVDITGENLLSIAITEMQLLMEPTQPYVLNKYDDYNRLAYHVEYAKMCKFRENLPALQNGDLSAEELKFLVRECLLTYYVHTERED